MSTLYAIDSNLQFLELESETGKFKLVRHISKLAMLFKFEFNCSNWNEFTSNFSKLDLSRFQYIKRDYSWSNPIIITVHCDNYSGNLLTAKFQTR